MQKAHVIRILHGRYELFPGRMRFYAWPRKGSKMKTISFAVPCYNSAAYMDKCIESLLACDEGKNDIEILIVDDGSTKDNTAEIADAWQKKCPGTIRAIHKPNGGHGSAVNTGSPMLRAAISRSSTPTTGLTKTPCMKLWHTYAAKWSSQSRPIW